MSSTITKRKYVRNTALDNSAIAKLGESISTALLLRYNFFDIEKLGGVVPAFDLLCTIKDKKKPYMFLVQVKAMENGTYTKCSPIRIKTPVPPEKLKWLVARPLPSYVMGVAVDSNEAFIAPAYDNNQKYNSIPVKYRVTYSDKTALKVILEKIKNDVIDYWDGIFILKYKQNFKSTLV